MEAACAGCDKVRQCKKNLKYSKKIESLVNNISISSK